MSSVKWYVYKRHSKSQSQLLSGEDVVFFRAAYCETGVAEVGDLDLKVGLLEHVFVRLQLHLQIDRCLRVGIVGRVRPMNLSRQVH